MNIKKILWLLMTCVLVLTATVLPLTVSAEDSSDAAETTAVLDPNKLNISVGTASGKQGDMIDIPVTFETNPGVWGVSLDVHYDEKVLALQTVTFGEGFKDSMSLLDVDNYYIPFALNATGNSLTTNVTTTGLFATMHFLIIPGCPLGETTVSVTYKPANVIDVDGNNVLTSIPQKAGVVSVAKGKDAEPGVTYRPQRTTAKNTPATKAGGSQLPLILCLAGAVVAVGVVLVILVMRKPAEAPKAETAKPAEAPKQAEDKPAEDKPADPPVDDQV